MLLLIALNFFLSGNAYARQIVTDATTNLLGCAGCFNFVAPKVGSAESIGSPSVGLIIFDSGKKEFRGYDSNSWLKISNNYSATNTISMNSTITLADEVVTASAQHTELVINLPSLTVDTKGKKIFIKRTDLTNGKVKIVAAPNEYIDGSTSIYLARIYDSVELVSDGDSWMNMSKTVTHAPTVKILTSGSGTYTTPKGVSYIRVKMVGAGGGGAGSSDNASGPDGGQGGSGGDTLFGTSLLSATGGLGGQNQNDGIGGSAGQGIISSVLVIGEGLSGSPGINGTSLRSTSVIPSPGAGGSSKFGGGARSPSFGPGLDAAVNSGGGGSGAGVTNIADVNIYSGGGGGSGGYVDAIIRNPNVTYFYMVGAGGAKGSAGSFGSEGGSGASGQIYIEEYY